VWADEFDKDLDLCNWHFELGTGSGGWGNNEHEFYTSRTQNVHVQNGSLVIKAIPEDYAGSQFTSTRMLSNRAWTFGKFEVKAKLPKGKQLWPAIWMMPANSDYGFWAGSGEVDIVELRGDKPSVVQGSLHFGGQWPNNAYAGSGEKTFTKDFTADYHVFTLEWEPKQFTWAIDGDVYHTENIDKSMWSGKGTNPYTKNGQPFDKPFFLILNIAVGGNFFPNDQYGAAVTQADAKNWAKPTMEVDYIRVYQK